LIRPHSIILRDGELVLRPLTESDWPLLSRWNRRTEVLRWTEGDAGAEPWPLEQVQRVYRGVAQTALCFIIKWRGAEIGECWLQRMNLDSISARYPDADVRRIDIAIYEPRLWSRGIGSRAIALLVRLGFEVEGADAIFGIVAHDNPRSRRAFEKCGFSLDQTFAFASGATDLQLVRRRA
jgi:aminoglycoside 2''-phosphotransferase